MLAFVDDLLFAQYTLGEGRVLLYVNTGINQVIKIWLEAVQGGEAGQGEAERERRIERATRLIDRNVAAVQGELVQVVSISRERQQLINRSWVDR